MDLVAISGCPRSGTSALCNLLMQDRRIMMFDELTVFSCWNSGGVSKRIISKWLKPDTNFSHLVELSGLDPTEFKKFIDRPGHITGKELYAYIEENTVATMFGDKCPESYVYNTEKLAEQFPKMKFLFSQRDGRGVIASHVRKPRSSVPNIETGANLWVNTTSKGIDMVKKMPDRCKIIKYEEAVMDPEPMLADMSDFLGLDTVIVNGINFKNVPYYRPVNLDSWKEEIPDVLDKIRNPKFKELMLSCGYI